MYDVIVSGAGPAGAYAAYKCAKGGLNVLLLDKGTRGRRKCCAGGMLRRAIKELDFQLPQRIIERQVTGFSFVAEGARYSIPFGTEMVSMVRRDELDAFLIDKAEEQGVDILEGAMVQKGVEGDSNVSVLTSRGSFQSHFVIIAEGAGSGLANALCGTNRRNWAAVGCAVEGMLGNPPRDEIDIYLNSYSRSLRPPSSFPLTGAVFPLSDSVIVSFVGIREPRAAFEKAISKVLESLKEEHGNIEVLRKPCYHPIPMVPRPRLSSSRVLVVGDAAGLASPFSGEGLSSAFLSANVASEVLIEAFSSNTMEAGAYASQCHKQILPRLRVAGILGPFLHYSVNVIGHERLFPRFRKEEALIKSFGAFINGEIGTYPFVLKVIPHLPDLLIGH